MTEPFDNETDNLTNPAGGPLSSSPMDVPPVNPNVMTPEDNKDPHPTENPDPIVESVAEAKDDGVDPEMPKGEPNVRLSKSQEDKALGKGLLNIGMHEGIMIPTVATQLAGFFVQDPSALVNQFPQYKFIQVKGTERPA